MTRLIRVHGQLADIAQGSHDSYGEHLHKGIGLYYTVRSYKGVNIGDTKISPDALLAKAQTELILAHEMKPEESQPSWYLYGVYRAQKRLDQAETCLRLAHQNARQSRLTSTEGRGIDLAMHNLSTQTTRR